MHHKIRCLSKGVILAVNEGYSLVSELGWELHLPMENVSKQYDKLMEAGAEFGIVNFGTYVVNSLLLEKASDGAATLITLPIDK